MLFIAIWSSCDLIVANLILFFDFGTKFQQGPDGAPQLDTSAALSHCSEKIFFGALEEAKTCVNGSPRSG